MYTHSNWNAIAQHSFKDYVTVEEFVESKGYWKNTNVWPVKLAEFEQFRQAELSEIAIAELDEIISLCKEKGTEVIFYTTPYQVTPEWGNDVSWSNAIQEYADANGCVYFDFMKLQEEAGINPETDFSDPDHLNDSGACKIAAYLGKYIVDNYEVTDMRQVEGNIWE